jgi:hypothetical protein
VAVVAYSFAHDDPTPGLSQRGLVTVALAAAVVVLLTLHRRYGPGPLARALAEYTVVAVLAGLLATSTGAGVDQQPADHAAPAKADEARPEAKPAVGDDRPAVLQVPAKVIRAVTGAVGWLIDLWRQASQRTEPANGQAMAARPLSPLPVYFSCWRSP